ncbi:hypothetical protein ACROYT_G007253 [Oculina patagonica]
MVLRQCLACNILITESSRSCVCGHVLEDANRYIGGKRFSEYRAQLYSRLENKKRKKELREIQEQSKPLQEHKTLMSGALSEQPSFKPEKRRSTVVRAPNRKKRCKRMPRLQTGLSSSTKRQADKNAVPPELLSRFPSALQEINRRIMGQNFLWLALQLD